jgi:hypothetical protein
MTCTHIPRPTLIAYIATIVFAPTCFGGTVIFDNLANLGIPGVGFGAIPVPGIFQYIAEGFTVPAGVDYRLTSFDIPIFVPTGGVNLGLNEVAVFVMNDVGGLPTNILESFQLFNLPTGTNTAALTTVNSVSRPVLANGSQYWIAVTGATSSTFGGWDLTTTTGVSAFRQIINGIDQGWSAPLSPNPSPTLGLRVTGDAVPEPGSVQLLVAGLMAIAAFRIQRRWARGA